MVEYVNTTDDHPLIVAAVVHYQLVTIHPFEDGNGRTGRLILFRECLRNDIIPFVIEDANRHEYVEALKAYRENDCEKLVALFRKEQEFYCNKCSYFFE